MKKVTFVLYANHINYMKQTYKSLQVQDMSEVKLVLVADAKEQQLISDLKEMAKGAADCEIIDAGKGFKEIREHVCGLVFFLKEGVRLKKNAISVILSQMPDRGEERTVLLPVRVDRKNPVSVEYEEFCNRDKTDRDLTQDYTLLHRMYFAHGIYEEMLVWDALKDETTDPELAIICLVSASVCKARKIRVLRKTDIWVEGFRIMEAVVNEYMQSYEGITVFEREFFNPFRAMLTDLGISQTKNGQYLLLYYCNRILSAITQLEKRGEHRKKGLEQTYVDTLMEVPDLSVLAMHPYITAGFKHVMVEKYNLTEKTGEPEEYRQIIMPQYRRIFLYEIKTQDDMLYLEFSFLQMRQEQYELYCCNGEESYCCEKLYTRREGYFLDEKYGTNYIYEVRIPCKKKMDLFLAVKDGDRLIPFENIRPQRTVPFSYGILLYKKYQGICYYTDKDCRTLYVRRQNPLREIWLFLRRTGSILSYGKIGVKALMARMLYRLQKTFDHREVWLLTDRANRADDNGEVMFRYLAEQKNPKRDLYFVIDEKAEDNKRMKQYGKTVSPFSWKHKLLFLRSEVTMSSQANKMVVNPFGILECLYRDIMYDKKLVFLQHGVTKDNQSQWLNKYNRNLYGFVVNTKAEYDSIFLYDYFYTPEHVWLTGMPRFDRLYHDEKKYVTIMPTWRKSLSKGTDENGVWLLDDTFTESDYYAFYNSLLNDERLLQAAQNRGYTICFMPHPNTITGLKYFKKNDKVQFFDMTKSYREVFAQTDLMVTDYSSVAFDFAYLRKPIIYAQFDRADFFSGAHSYTEGYFDYDKDGFGEVTQDLDTTVDAIIKAMENNCELEDTYKARIDATFAFDDRNCCKRVLERFEKERNGRYEVR